jgi:hypothetical protein
MARFKIATVDGYEITVEHPSETPEDFRSTAGSRPELLLKVEILHDGGAGARRILPKWAAAHFDRSASYFPAQN